MPPRFLIFIIQSGPDRTRGSKRQIHPTSRRLLWSAARRKASCCDLGRNGVVEKTGGPLESCDSKNLWQDFQMPVEIRFNCLPMASSPTEERSILQGQIVGRFSQSSVKLLQDIAQDLGQALSLG